MRLVRLFALTLLALPVPVAAPAHEPDILVRGDASRIEIERVLAADNVDTSRLSPGEVVEAISRIERGRAPADFWKAYRALVEAWQRLAATEAAIASDARSTRKESELRIAEQAIEATFDQVERIARRYGAQLPPPAWSASRD